MSLKGKIALLHLYRPSQLRVPDLMLRSARELGNPEIYEFLRHLGIKVVAFDLENTLEELDATKLSRTSLELLRDLQFKGLYVLIFTNTTRDLSAMRRQLHDELPGKVPVLQPQGRVRKKPDSSVWNHIRQTATTVWQIHTSPRIAYVGDKLDHDTSAAQRHGFTGILVNPIGADLRAEQRIWMRRRETWALRHYFNLERPA